MAVELIIEGEAIDTGTDSTGYPIAHSEDTDFSFLNNSFVSSAEGGYMLNCGDESSGSYNNNLDGMIIAGNKFTWNGATQNSITHSIFPGYQKNIHVRYNYLLRCPMAIIRKSDGEADTTGGIYYNIVKDAYAVSVNLKGQSDVKIYNNTIYNSRTTSQHWRGLVHIYNNNDTSEKSSGAKIKNNIFYTVYQLSNITIVDSECVTGFESDYNVFYCEAGTPMFNYLGDSKTFAQWQALGYDLNSKVVNPNFINTTDLVPSARLNYGTNLGSSFNTGLSVNAVWTRGVDPATAVQDSTWQVGARVHTTFVGSPKTYYVATTGSDGNAGTITYPWRTLQYAFNRLVAGDTLYVRGGTYAPLSTLVASSLCGVGVSGKNGTSGSRITVENYTGETVTLDCRNFTATGYERYGILLYNSDYWTIKGINITRVDQQLSGAYGGNGLSILNGENNTIERCTSYVNGGPGFQTRGSVGGTYFLNCDSYENYDPYSTEAPGEHADGFDLGDCNSDCEVELEGCRAWDNSDDGFDMYQHEGHSGIITTRNCWAWHNGYIPGTETEAGNGCGFKYGDDFTGNYSITRRFSYNCIAFNNRTRGFSQEAAMVKKEIYNCISYSNDLQGFSFVGLDVPDIIRNCVAVDDDVDSIGTIRTSDHNSWSHEVMVTVADFVSISGSLLETARQSDGTLPVITFLHLDVTSDLIGAGIPIASNPYDGDGVAWNTIPAMGAFEYALPDEALAGHTIGTGSIDAFLGREGYAACRGKIYGESSVSATFAPVIMLISGQTNGTSWTRGRMRKVGWVFDTNDFTLFDVCEIVQPDVDTLDRCFLYAIDCMFDPVYEGDHDRLSNFRNYGPRCNNGVRGITNGVATVTGTLVGKGSLAGITGGIADVFSELSKLDVMIGVTGRNEGATVIGTLHGHGVLAGQTNGVATVGAVIKILGTKIYGATYGRSGETVGPYYGPGMPHYSYENGSIREYGFSFTPLTPFFFSTLTAYINQVGSPDFVMTFKLATADANGCPVSDIATLWTFNASTLSISGSTTWTNNMTTALTANTRYVIYVTYSSVITNNEYNKVSYVLNYETDVSPTSNTSYRLNYGSWAFYSNEELKDIQVVLAGVIGTLTVGSAVANMSGQTNGSATVTGQMNDVTVNSYGYLYNWYAVTDSKNIANTGWHAPTAEDSYYLWERTIGTGYPYGGEKMREEGTTHWIEGTGTDEYGFKAIGSGFRNAESGVFESLKSIAYFKLTDENDADTSLQMALYESTNEYHISAIFLKRYGGSVRLIKDSTTLSPGETGTYTGNDGKTYNTIAIGDSTGVQEWMSENLAETKFRDGDSIEYVPEDSKWIAMTTHAYCIYGIRVASISGSTNGEATVTGQVDHTMVNSYGYLYNWYAVTDSKNIANTGWHMSLDSEYEDLAVVLGATLTPSIFGGYSIDTNTVGGKVKETGLTYWNNPNTGATNETGFNGRGAGYRSQYTGAFFYQKAYTYFAVGDDLVSNPFMPCGCVLSSSNSEFQDWTWGGDTNGAKGGMSVRLIKDSTTLESGETGTYTGNDGKIYPTIAIGDSTGVQEWLACNLAETKFRDGDPIEYVPEDSEWITKTTHAWCIYGISNPFGASNAGATVTGTLTTRQPISGQTNGSSNVTGDIEAAVNDLIYGSVPAVATVTGTLRGAHTVSIISRGAGTGVAYLRFKVSADVVCTLDGNARFYSDTAGTLNESTSFTYTGTTGYGSVRYIKCTSGTSKLYYDKPENIIDFGYVASASSGADFYGYGSGSYADIPKYQDNNWNFPNVVQVSNLGGSTLVDIVNNISVFGDTVTKLVVTGLTGNLSDAPSSLTILSLHYFNIGGNISDLPSTLTQLNLVSNSGTISGAAADLPDGLTYLQIAYGATLSGNISGFPSGLVTLYCSSMNNTLTGDVADFPTSLTEIEIGGSSTIYGDVADLPSGLTRLYLMSNGNYLSGDIADFPTGLKYFRTGGASGTLTGDIANIITGTTYFDVSGGNTLYGSVANIGTSMVEFSVAGTNTISGSIADMNATSLQLFYVSGSNTISGAFDSGFRDMSSNFYYIFVTGSNTISGDLAYLPSAIRYLYITGNNTISDYTGRTWVNYQQVIYVVPTTGGGLSSTEVDNILIDLADDVATWSSSKMVTLTGTNAARTSASDSAVTTLQGKGVTVTTNP